MQRLYKRNMASDQEESLTKRVNRSQNIHIIQDSEIIAFSVKILIVPALLDTRFLSHHTLDHTSNNYCQGYFKTSLVS